MFSGDADNLDSHNHLLNVLAGVMANPGSNNAHLRGGSLSVVMNPDHALTLHKAGLTRQDIQHELCQRAAISMGDLRKIGSMFAGHSDKADDELVQILDDPSRILVLQAGGSGLYSMVMPSWCAGANHNGIVHAEIELDQACEVPGMNPGDITL
jgi:hypothetical protein